MALSICANLANKQLDLVPFRNTLTGIAIDLAHFWQHPIQRSHPNLDVVFSAPNENEPAEFEGMRLHSYESESDTLKVELSIPHQIYRSKHAKSYVVAAIQEAVDAAEDFFKIQNIVFEKDAYLNLINTLSACSGKKLH